MKTLIMKLAVLVFFSLDARAGVIPQPELRPFDEVLRDFKGRVADNILPADIVEAGCNQMELWTQSAGKVRAHRFDLETVNHGEPIFEVQVSESDPELESARARIAELEPLSEQLSETAVKLESALIRIAELESQEEQVSRPDPATPAAADIPPAGVSLTSAPEKDPPKSESKPVEKESTPELERSLEVSSAAPSARKRVNNSA